MSTEPCIVKRADGVYVDSAASGSTLVAAIDGIYRAGELLAGLDYPVFLQALFRHGPARAPGADGMLRIGAAIRPFDPARRALYRPLKIGAGRAEYYFEPVWLDAPQDPSVPDAPARLDPDEFIADLWLKGIRFGIDLGAVRTAMAATRADRVTVARRLEPVAGEDARIVEVSDDIHRSNAPRQLANGRLDLHSFQNRFPQIRPGVRLLQKIPASAGSTGYEMSGAPIAPAPGRDTDLAPYAGAGTKIERNRDGEFLVSQRAGFLAVDAKSSRIAIEDKIVSRDGVSARTTGNLQLTGDYEEFGDVQEKRVIEGTSITVHGDVYGELVSRGGTVRLRANLVGGRATNKAGDIVVDGVASSAQIGTLAGTVTLQRAENCVISATRVRIEHAVNCEIIADELHLGRAEGCALAARNIRIDATAPWRDSEMLVYAMAADCGRIDEVLGQVRARLAQIAGVVHHHKTELAHLCARPEVRKYLEIAGKVRSGEMSLSPAQNAQFRQMGQVVAPDLQKIGEVSNARKAAEAEQTEGQALLGRFEAQRAERAAFTRVHIGHLAGDTQVRMLPYDPDGACFYHLAPREIKLRLRGAEGTRLHAGAGSGYQWNNGEAVQAG